MAIQRDGREMQQPPPEPEEGASDGSTKEVPNVERLRGMDEAARPLEGENVDGGGEGDVDDGGGSEDFEFAVLPRRSFDGVDAVTADEIFSNGLIRPVYPLFGSPLVFRDGEIQGQRRDGGGASAAATGEAEEPLKVPLRKLMIQDRNAPSTSSTESDELDGLSAGSYCVWTPRSLPPSPDLRRKSHSTGTTSKRWRFFNLVVGRSHSDGKEKLVFLEPPHPSAEAATQKKSNKPASGDRSKKTAAVGEVTRGRGNGRGGGRVTEMDMVTAHRLFYSRGGAAPGDRRRSFLPYRKDLVGLFFGNAAHAAGQGFQPS